MNGAGMQKRASDLNIQLSRLPKSAEQPIGTERSLLTLSGKNRLGLISGVSSYLRECDANVESSFSRRIDDLWGTQNFLFVAEPQAMQKINEDEIYARCCLNDDDHDFQLFAKSTRKFQLTVVAPDRKGILATVAEMLLQRRVPILSSETITFKTPLGPELGGNGELVKTCMLDILLAMTEPAYDQTLKSLKDGLEYLEHRYHWYIQLERHLKRPKEGQSLLPAMDRPNAFALN